MPKYPDCFNISPPNWKRLRSPWFDRKVIEKNNDPMLIGQELQIEYLASGSPRFDSAVLEALRVTLSEPVKTFRPVFVADTVQLIEEAGGPLHVFALPQPGHTYTIGADAASGEAGSGTLGHSRASKTGIVVTDNTDFPRKVSVVATMSSAQLEPANAAQLIALLGRMYNNALAVPEVNGPGIAVLQALKGKGQKKPMYHFIYRQERTRPDAQGQTFRLGWCNNNSTRPILEKQISDYLTKLRIADYRLLDELMSFIWTVVGDTVRGKAAKGCNDDLVMSLGLSLLGAERWHGKRTTEKPSAITADKLREAMQERAMTAEEVLYAMTRGLQ